MLFCYCLGCGLSSSSPTPQSSLDSWCLANLALSLHSSIRKKDTFVMVLNLRIGIDMKGIILALGKEVFIGG